MKHLYRIHLEQSAFLFFEEGRGERRIFKVQTPEEIEEDAIENFANTTLSFLKIEENQKLVKRIASMKKFLLEKRRNLGFDEASKRVHCVLEKLAKQTVSPEEAYEEVVRALEESPVEQVLETTKERVQKNII